MQENELQPKAENTFCWYPFYQLALKKFIGKEFKNAAPCCNSIRPGNEDPLNLDDKIGDLTPEDIFHSAPMQKLRRDLLSGVKNEACQVCWESEVHGNASYRYQSKPNELLDLPVDPMNPTLTALDLSFGEECNLRCRMCTPGQSNKLRIDDNFFRENKTPGAPFYLPGWNDAKKSDPSAVYYFDENSFHFDAILDHQPKLKLLRATGGETMRTKGFQIFVDRAIANGTAKEITLAYHTNAAKFTDGIVEKLKEFKANFPCFSIDSVGKNYEYIRHPMPWPMLEKSVHNFLTKVPTRGLAGNSAVSMLNLHYVTELAEWAIKTVTPYAPVGGHEIFLNYNFDPVWPTGRPIDVSWLPEPILRGQIDKIKKFQASLNTPWFYFTVHTLINHLEFALQKRTSEADPLLIKKQNEMYLEVTAFDKSRDQSYRDFLHPEMVEFLDIVGDRIQTQNTNSPSPS